MTYLEKTHYEDVMENNKDVYWDRNLLFGSMHIIKGNVLYKNLVQFYNSPDSPQNQLIAEFIEKFRRKWRRY